MSVADPFHIQLLAEALSITASLVALRASASGPTVTLEIDVSTDPTLPPDFAEKADEYLAGQRRLLAQMEEHAKAEALITDDLRQIAQRSEEMLTQTEDVSTALRSEITKGTVIAAAAHNAYDDLLDQGFAYRVLAPAKSPKRLEATLNELGGERWRLVATDPKTGNLILLRPR